MSEWTDFSDVRRKLLRKWDRGEFLAARLKNEPLVLRYSLKKPGTKDWVERFDDTHTWLDALIVAGKKYCFEIESKEITHRQRGRNRFPQSVLFDSDEALFKCIGKLGSVHRFDDISDLILGSFPELKPWLEKRALVALAHYDDWPRIFAVLVFLKQHPRPGIYVRQLQVPAVDTKFIEKRRKLLSELLDLVLPEEAIDWDEKGVKRFEQRYGFLPTPLQVRFRILDPEHYISGLSDLQLTVQEFCKLHIDIDTVFITENEKNGLSFPEVKRGIVIFKLGFALTRLTDIDWLHSKKIYYWGDIDTDGYGMLDQLRAYFPHVESFLMDKQTLLAHHSQWVVDGTPSKRELQRLLPDEQEVYQLLLRDELAVQLRLEQEKVSYHLVKEQLAGLGLATF